MNKLLLRDTLLPRAPGGHTRASLKLYSPLTDNLQLELHQVTTTVSQPAIAAMRLQFWRDALSAIYSDNKPVPQHPVAIALAEMRKARPVMKYYLSQMIEVRVSAEPFSLGGGQCQGHSGHVNRDWTGDHEALACTARERHRPWPHCRLDLPYVTSRK